MSQVRRLGSMALCVLLVFTQAGCYTQRRVPLSESSAQRRLSEAPGQPIVGYTTASGQRVEFKGFAQVRGDSIHFIQPRERARWLYAGKPASDYALPLESVSQLDIRFGNPIGMALASIGVAVLVLGVLAVIVIATKESCPFIYAWDGSGFVFDGEPYGGATTQGLERTDWSELEHLKPVDGHYRLMLTNEVDETQHTNRLELLVVDHQAGARVVMDAKGQPHALSNSSSLVEARDATGADLTHWLRDDDRIVWTPDLGRYAAMDSLTETREHITLRFALPRNEDTVFLVSRAGTGQWGSHMIRSMLGLRGDRVGAFYALIDSNAFFRDQLLAWNQREELYELGVEVHEREGWRRIGMIPGGGPFILESRALPIPLGHVEGPVLELRIHPPIGYWALNSFQLGWGETEMTVRRVPARSATDHNGASVKDLLGSDDDRYLDFPTTNERATLEFAAPPLVAGRARTVFAETRGWYRIHMHRNGEPDLAAIEELTYEPGHAVRLALREFREFRRTGVLAGTAAAAGR